MKFHEIPPGVPMSLPEVGPLFCRFAEGYQASKCMLFVLETGDVTHARLLAGDTYLTRDDYTPSDIIFSKPAPEPKYGSKKNGEPALVGQTPGVSSSLIPVGIEPNEIDYYNNMLNGD